MAKGKRTDAITKAKIIEAKINAPDSSTRDIEESTGLPHETVAKVLREDLAQVCTQSSRIASLIDTNNNLQSLVDARIESMLKSGEIVIRLSELTGLRESTFKQNQLLTDSSTENTKLVIEWANED